MIGNSAGARLFTMIWHELRLEISSCLALPTSYLERKIKGETKSIAPSPTFLDRLLQGIGTRRQLKDLLVRQHCHQTAFISSLSQPATL